MVCKSFKYTLAPMEYVNSNCLNISKITPEKIDRLSRLFMLHLKKASLKYVLKVMYFTYIYTNILSRVGDKSDGTALRCVARPSGAWPGLAHKKRKHNKCKFLLLAL